VASLPTLCPARWPATEAWDTGGGTSSLERATAHRDCAAVGSMAQSTVDSKRRSRAATGMRPATRLSGRVVVARPYTPGVVKRGQSEAGRLRKHCPGRCAIVARLPAAPAQVAWHATRRRTRDGAAPRCSPPPSRTTAVGAALLLESYALLARGKPMSGLPWIPCIIPSAPSRAAMVPLSYPGGSIFGAPPCPRLLRFFSIGVQWRRWCGMPR
jgi:hypothetical protein